jgi:hypothetical protein
MARVQISNAGKVVFEGLRPLDQPLATIGSWPVGVDAAASGGGDDGHAAIIAVLFPADRPASIVVGGREFRGDSIRVSAEKTTAPVRYLEGARLEFNLDRIDLVGESATPASLPPIVAGHDGTVPGLRVPTESGRRYRLVGNRRPDSAVWDAVSSFVGDGTTKSIPLPGAMDPKAADASFFRVLAE